MYQGLTPLRYEAVVIGVSAGGLTALTEILPVLSGDFPLPVIIVQHLHAMQERFLFEYFNSRCALTVKEADEKEPIQQGHIYFAPPNYHLLIEADRTFSLSIDERVNFSRPSIDVLFESAAHVYCGALIGIILTGANNDGAYGLKLIKKNKGLTIVQDPTTAESDYMPRSAIAEVHVDHVLPLKEIGPFLQNLHVPQRSER